ncbi:MAG: hypothetical protein FWF33_07265 [Clostridiales bacterium]|nr:hypothetical protein [Clostridiales bacterium]
MSIATGTGEIVTKHRISHSTVTIWRLLHTLSRLHFVETQEDLVSEAAKKKYLKKVLHMT